MATYSFAPNPSPYVGSGGWFSGMGQSMGVGLETGINLNNSLRNMQDANAISPYAVSAAQSRLTQDRIGSILGGVENQGMLERLLGRMRLDENQQMGTPQPLASPVQGTLDLNALARSIGAQTVSGGETDPMLTSGMSGANQMLGLTQYVFNQPLYHRALATARGF